MLLVALLVGLCMPAMAQNANTALDLDDVTGASIDNVVGNVVYIQNVATGLYLKAGGEWGTNAVEGRAAQPFLLEKRADGSYVISSIAGFFHSSDMWVDWKLRKDSRWTLTRVAGTESGVYQYYLTNASGRALASQGHAAGQLAMSKHNSNNYSQKWVFVTEALLKEQMGHETVTASTPIDVTPFIKASSFDLTDGILMNSPDSKEPWKDDNDNNISSLPIYSKLGVAAYSRNWNNFSTYGRYNWHSMIRGGWGETSVYNGAGIISEGTMTREINISQTVNSLPAGKYYFSFEGFYRYQETATDQFGNFIGGLIDLIFGTNIQEANKPKFQVRLTSGNTPIHTFNLDANTDIAIEDADSDELPGQQVATVFRDNDRYKQYYEFELTSAQSVTISIYKSSTSSDATWICVDNFTLVYYGSNTSTPDVEDLSDLYNSRLEAYIEKIREELSNYQGATDELIDEALGVFNDGIVDVVNAMANKEITTEELYREALSVIDQAYREALALLNKPEEGDKTSLILNPSFETAASNNPSTAASWFNAARENNALKTHGSYIGTSTGAPIVQKVNNLPYGLYRMTADVTSAVGNTVYLMGNYYHKGIEITNANKLETVELYFLLDDGYNGDLEGRLSTVLGVIGGSGDGNKYYNFRGIETVSENESDTKTVSKVLNSSSAENHTYFDDATGKLIHSSSGSWSSSRLNISTGENITITATPKAGEQLLITKVKITCTASDRRGSDKNTVTEGYQMSLPSKQNYIEITATNGGANQCVLTNGSYSNMRVKAIEIEYVRNHSFVTYDRVQEPVVQGCPFKVDNFKLYWVSDVPNGRLFMELQKARNAQFTDGITADIAQYEAMFQNRSVDNTKGGSDYGYNPALRVMEILRNTAKQQRSEDADMTYAIFNQTFDYWSGHGWGVISAGDDGTQDLGERVNHFQFTTSVTDAEGKFLLNSWRGLDGHQGSGAHMAQTIEGLPNGRYKLEAVVAAGDNGKAGTVYLTAQTSAQTEIYKNSAVDNSAGKVMTPISLEFDVTDGKATIGVVGGSVTDGSYVAHDDATKHRLWYKADNFRLTYLGKEIEFFEKNTEIEQVQDYYTTVTLNRTLKANSTWSSFVVPFDIPAEQLTGWDVKELVSSELKNNGEHISLVFGDATDGIKAGVPYMVRNTSLTDAITKIEMSNVSVNTKVLNHRATDVIAFIGVYARQQIPAGAYFISDNKFYKAVDTSVNTSAKPDMISGFRGYFQVLKTDETANVRSMSFRIEGEDETDIEDVAQDEQLEVVGIYTVDGTRLNELKPGINILRMNNGTTKKVMVK